MPKSPIITYHIVHSQENTCLTNPYIYHPKRSNFFEKWILIILSILLIGNEFIAVSWNVPYFLTPVGFIWYLIPVQVS